jgi:hypothetical protein
VRDEGVLSECRSEKTIVFKLKYPSPTLLVDRDCLSASVLPKAKSTAGPRGKSRTVRIDIVARPLSNDREQQERVYNDDVLLQYGG